MNKCHSCSSCGMPLQNPSDHALADETIPYCSHCTNKDGSLKSYEEVLEGTKGYFIDYQGLDPQAAQKMAENVLKKQPAWIKRRTQ
ncbi:MAG: AraC family transcriptional regulator [Verrucomicrobia bacterium]|nr:AraC family transcriptional regulator [Verrucomicrobiota bacterium]